MNRHYYISLVIRLIKLAQRKTMTYPGSRTFRRAKVCSVPGASRPFLTDISIPSNVTLQTTHAWRYFCKLNIQLEAILQNMYSPERPNARSLSFVRTATERLDKWRQEQPDDLKLDSPMLPVTTPPTHIVVQK